jgi:hypothetical protein
MTLWDKLSALGRNKKEDSTMADATTPAVNPAVKILTDLGNAFAIFTAADPTKTNAEIIKFLPPVLAGAQALTIPGLNIEQLIPILLEGAMMVAGNVFTGGASGTVTEIAAGLPAISALVADIMALVQNQVPNPA